MSQKNNAIFFLSTGRCGTQWLHKTFKAVYSDIATIAHEPVRYAYQAKRYLRANDKFDELLSSRQVSRHLLKVHKILQTKTYIETGWPSYPALPFIIDQLDGRIRIVHLVRHPVFTALSLATHKVYQRPDWVKGFAISPFDQGVIQKELASAWLTMSMYEKCLFWWTEINLYALDLQAQYPDLEFYFLRYEDLFGEAMGVIKTVVDFIGLNYEPAIQMHKLKTVDQFHFKLGPLDWTSIFNYPQTVALAEQFGYELDQTQMSQITHRYFEERIINHLIQDVKKVSWLVIDNIRAKIF